MISIIKKILNIKEVEKDVDGKTDRVVHAKQKALELSINEGSATQASAVVGSSYLTPFALALKASPFQIGILSSVSGLVQPLSQLYGSKMMLFHSRKKLVLKFALLQAITWLPIAALAILFWKGFFQDYLIYALIVLYSIMMIFMGISHPPWFSWMGDLVPEKDRGRYFSIRNRATELVGMSVAMMAAFLLDAFKTKGLLLIGFAVLFASAFTFRMASIVMLKKQYSPEFKMKKSSYFSFWNFLKTFDNYGKYSVYQAAFYFALMIASPFFAVYMLEELDFSYVTYTTILLSSGIFYLIFLPLAGKFSDKYGNLKLLYIANFLFVLSPLLWLFLKTPMQLIFLPQLVSGMANAALVIATTNFTFDAVSQQRRGICVSYTSLLAGIGTFFGSLLGGYLLNNLSLVWISSFFFVFILASFLRFVVAIAFLPKLKEERTKVRKLPPMHISIMHPFKTLHAEIGWFKNVFK